jgi:hypothetical protein
MFIVNRTESATTSIPHAKDSRTAIDSRRKEGVTTYNKHNKNTFDRFA